MDWLWPSVWSFQYNCNFWANKSNYIFASCYAWLYLTTVIELIFFFIFALSFSIQLHQFLRTIFFNNSAGETITFNQDRELVAGFDVISWIVSSNQSFQRVKVGRVDPQAPPDKVFTINEDAITWHSWFNQVQLLLVWKGTTLRTKSYFIPSEGH